MMTALRRILGVMLFASAGAVAAAEGPHLETAHSNRLDLESLQRGARNFVNYCLNCHSAQYMRYNRLTDLGLTEQQIADNLMFATDKVGNPMTVAMSGRREDMARREPTRPDRRGSGAGKGLALQLFPGLLP